MIEFKIPAKANHIHCDCTAAANTNTLATKPARGGIPESERNATIIARARKGDRLLNPE